MEKLLQALSWNASRAHVLEKVRRRPAGAEPVLCSRHATFHSAYVVATGLRRAWPDLIFSVRDVTDQSSVWNGEIYARRGNT
jgi:hypothetical protein